MTVRTLGAHAMRIIQHERESDRCARATRQATRRERRTKGVAPITAKHKMSKPRIVSSARSSRVARSRATERAAGTSAVGGNARSRALPRRSKCAAMGQTNQAGRHRARRQPESSRSDLPMRRALFARLLPGHPRYSATRASRRGSRAALTRAALALRARPDSAGARQRRRSRHALRLPGSANRNGPVNGKPRLVRVEHARDGRASSTVPRAGNQRVLCTIRQIEQITQHHYARAAQRAPFDARHRALERRQIAVQVRAQFGPVSSAPTTRSNASHTGRQGQLHGALRRRTNRARHDPRADRDFGERRRDQRGKRVLCAGRAVALVAHRPTGIDQQAQRAVRLSFELAARASSPWRRRRGDDR